MASPIGFRQLKVFENVNVPANNPIVIDNLNGAYLYHEVTNDTAGTLYITVNDNPQGGHPGDKIPIKANTTRVIPMSIYTFSTSGVLTVVSYGM